MKLYPLVFDPILKERVWGGRRLEQLYRKKLPPNLPVGESWEISDRPGDVSVVANGPLAGTSLHDLIKKFGKELVGDAALLQGRFPLLVKILDCEQKLSLQVHPPPGKAAELGGEPKTELWYIAQAAPGAELYVGLRRGCTREEFTQKITVGRVEDCFHRVRVRAGDAMFLPSGRVHALGAGLVIFEIQQNSDTTYRVFDWNRVGLDGKPRDLHINQSLESIDFEDFEPGLVEVRQHPGPVRRVNLVQHPLFAVDLSSMRRGEGQPLVSGKMQILGIVSGDVNVKTSEGELVLTAGQFCLVPAAVKDAVLQARTAASVLCVQAGEEAAL